MNEQTSSHQSPKEVEVSVEEASTSPQQVPGYLSVAVSNLSSAETDIKFFGVTQKGETPSGKGVSARQVKNLSSQEEEKSIALFDIEELLQRDQFTEGTVECVLTADEKELGREEFSYLSAIYLG